jgi:hypothetical protein
MIIFLTSTIIHSKKEIVEKIVSNIFFQSKIYF